MGKRKIGILVMSYGTPESMETVEAYYTHIRRGRPPAAEQLADLLRRYEAIGGLFPLRDNTNKQVKALEETINRMFSGVAEFVSYQGLRHAPPFIEDGVRQIAEDGIREAVGVVLAPHYSSMSVGGYIQRAQEQAAQSGVSMSFVESYHLHPKLIEALANRVRGAINSLSLQAEYRVIFTAHSLPERILRLQDPYVDQLMETSQAVADLAGVTDWQFSWQSAGQTGEPWLGPDLLVTLDVIAKEEQAKRVVVCPVGFVSDHLEVLYDIDIEASGHARKLGLELARTESLNVDPLYMETLAESVASKVERVT